MLLKYRSLLMLLLLPALILFDIGVYFVTRATCFECHNMGEFIRNSSLASNVIMESVRILKSKFA